MKLSLRVYMCSYTEGLLQFYGVELGVGVFAEPQNCDKH